ncbi:MAG TPA: TetR/AcrR family transcriptional regulator [Solirubrobacteraceae bacterium]|jgi:AcrR family transcriptional regulator|nr:TetR/AcrR family transcriptional regulator [Solirubrobacteraceae bacterium]
MASKDKTRSTVQRLRAAPLRPGPNGLPRGQVSEIQRSRMLTAAVEAVQEVGYSRLTVAQVIARARVSRKTFYDLFEDREDCFLAAFDQAVDQVSALVGEAYEQESNWRDGVRAGLLAALRFMDEEPGLARICIVEALGAGPRVLKRRTQILARLKKVIDQGRSSPGARVARATEESPDVTAEGVIGAVFAVLHTRVLARGREPFGSLLGPLMSMIVLPYLGARAASAELTRKPPPPLKRKRPPRRSVKDPLEGLDMRLTYRTVRVLTFIGENPGASNREIAEGAGIADQGQISKLLTRLERLELVHNTGEGQIRGASNEWFLTDRGAQVEHATRPR